MANNTLPAKRKRTLNPKLTSEDNVHRDAVKQRKELQHHTKISGNTSQSSCQASIEALDDPDDHVCHNADHPKNPQSILEATDEETDEDNQYTIKRRKGKQSHTKPSGTSSHSSRWASIEVVDNPVDHVCCNAGHLKNPQSILTYIS